jgi:polyhydroxyalkanoate synthesis regulator phasin
MKTSALLVAATAASLALFAGQAVCAQQAPPPASMAPGAPTTAAPGADVLNSRAARAEERINAGVEAGDLNRTEAHRALEELANIRTQENELATRDGGLNDTDRQAINERLTQLHRHITWLKNNDAYVW